MTQVISQNPTTMEILYRFQAANYGITVQPLWSASSFSVITHTVCEIFRQNRASRKGMAQHLTNGALQNICPTKFVHIGYTFCVALCMYVVHKCMHNVSL